MPVPTPWNPTYAAGSTPPWATTVAAAINAPLASAWNMGQRTKIVTLAAGQFGLSQFPKAAPELLAPFLDEYRAAGWSIAWRVSSQNAQGFPTEIEIRFSRWTDADGYTKLESPAGVF